MSFRFISTTLVAACALATTACDYNSGDSQSDCADAIANNKWCDAQSVGYVAGVQIKSHLLFDCLDAHGHDLVHAQIKCPTCQAAIKSDEYCDKCRIGWMKGLAYFSRLTYHMARGKLIHDRDIACAQCRRHHGIAGWCDACRRGIVGNVAFDSRVDFDGARRGFEIMLIANEASVKCQTCAMAIIADDSCFFCKKSYRNGKPVAAARSGH